MLANSQKDFKFSTIIADQCALIASLVFAIVARSYLPQIVPFEWKGSLHATLAFRHVAFALLWYFSMRAAGSYELKSNGGWGVWTAFKGTMLFTLIALAIAFFRWQLFSRGAILIFIFAGTLTAVLFRRMASFLYHRFADNTQGGRILLVGESPTAVGELSRLFRKCLKCDIISRAMIVDTFTSGSEDQLSSAFESLLAEVNPDEVILAFNSTSLDTITALLNVCNDRLLPWHFIPSLDQFVFGHSRTHLLAGVPLISVKSANLSGSNFLVKRFIDITVASAMLICASPIMLMIWIIVRLTSSGPAIFVQQRIGRNGSLFDLYKFRTMVITQDQSAHKEYVKDWIENQAYASDANQKVFKIVADNRVTPAGRFLRKYSLDELPQLINILKGDMSLVGPRPALGYEVQMYQNWHKERLIGIPGLTGEWQVGGRYNVCFDEMVKLDLEYLRNWTPARDFKVLLRTVPTVLNGTGK